MNKVAQQPVKLDMTIGDVVEKFPETAEVMLGYGLHCVGCAVNPYETVEQGAMGHGMSKETINQMLADINLAVTKLPDYPLNPDGITLSPRAIETLDAIAESEDKMGYGLTVKANEVNGGLDFELDLVEKPADGQKTLHWEGLDIFIDDKSLQAMKPSLIDYVKMEGGEGFKVTSLKPAELKKESGGCGDEGCGCSGQGCGSGNCGCD